MNPLPPLPAGDTQEISREFHGGSFGFGFQTPGHPAARSRRGENFTGYFIPPESTQPAAELHAYYVDVGAEPDQQRAHSRRAG